MTQVAPHFRPGSGLKDFLSAFGVTLDAYVAGVLKDSQDVGQASSDQDNDFFREIGGNRIQAGFRTLSSGWRMNDMHIGFIVQDKRNPKGPQDTAEAGYQKELASSLTHWLSRPYPLLDRATATPFTLTGDVPVLVTDPIGRSQAMLFSGGAYSAADAGGYALGVSFWVKAYTSGSRVIAFTGAHTFNIVISNTPKITVNFDSDSLDFTLAAPITAWTHIMVSVNNLTGYLTVSVDGVALTPQMMPTSGLVWDAFVINPDLATVSIYDLRTKMAVFSDGAAEYCYNDVVNNEGKKVLPI